MRRTRRTLSIRNPISQPETSAMPGQPPPGLLQGRRHRESGRSERKGRWKEGRNKATGEEEEPRRENKNPRGLATAGDNMRRNVLSDVPDGIRCVRSGRRLLFPLRPLLFSFSDVLQFSAEDGELKSVDVS